MGSPLKSRASVVVLLDPAGGNRWGTKAPTHRFRKALHRRVVGCGVTALAPRPVPPSWRCWTQQAATGNGEVRATCPARAMG